MTVEHLQNQQRGCASVQIKSISIYAGSKDIFFAGGIEQTHPILARNDRAMGKKHVFKLIKVIRIRATQATRLACQVTRTPNAFALREGTLNERWCEETFHH